MASLNQLNAWHISCLTAAPLRPDPVNRGRKGRGAAVRAFRNPGGGGRGRNGHQRLPWWRRLRRRLYWLLLLAVAGVADLLPVPVGRACGRALARLALLVRPRDRAQAAANLAWALPELDDRRRTQLLRASADAAGSNLFDTLVAGRLLDGPAAVTDLPDADGRGLVDLIVAERAAGRAVLVLSGHLGCWELHGAWLGRALAARGAGPLHVVTGTVRNPAVDRWLARRRESLGLSLLRREDGAGPLLACLRSGGVAAILVDQNTAVDSAPVPFFGRPAPTPTGPARLAVGLQATVVVTAMARTVDGRGHEVWHAPPWRADDAAPRQEQVTACLQWMNSHLEARIRRNPAEWVWYHRRWNMEAAPAAPVDKGGS
jgi:KDO2-lipid IV(A) lauroyltransferase